MQAITLSKTPSKGMIFVTLLLTSSPFFSLKAQERLHEPSIAEVLSLKNVGNPHISPDGQHVVFTQTRTDWKNNRYDTEIWLSKAGGVPFQLTHTPEGSSSQPSWSPDGHWIVFQSRRGEKSQLYAIRPNGGEAHPITQLEESLNGFAWAPDGKSMVLRIAEEESKEKKREKEVWGEFGVDEEEYTVSHLWLWEMELPLKDPVEYPCLEVDSSDCQAWPKPIRLTEGDFHVSGFSWSPDGKTLAVQHQPDANLLSFTRSDISLLDLETKELTPIVQNGAADQFITWSPDGTAFLYGSDLENDSSSFYANNRVFRYDLASGNSRELLSDFDEDVYAFTWVPQGLYFRANQRTKTPLFFMPTEGTSVTKVPIDLDVVGATDFTRDGKWVSFVGTKADGLGEVYHCNTADWVAKPLTQQTAQITHWKVAQSEVITWESKDGTEIEGVLHKPQGYDPSKKYPLLVRIHGGPTGTDRPSPVPAYVYPAIQWLNQGCLILRPNYRGSAGYGGAFRALNVRNLGVGDAWDVLSGVEHLVAQGLVDSSRMGCMGWSQGGYISAFLTTSSNQFKAISVGAGISDWMTYYVNTDIHPFTRQYLQANPWEDPEIYERTSPMTYINNASTPTLIQHGEFDKRVPIPNAYQLLQGLQDVGVPAKLIVYKGFGHGITKPKERLAASWHNFVWFNKYVWGKETAIPFLKVEAAESE